jgi:hypothetical protein
VSTAKRMAARSTTSRARTSQISSIDRSALRVLVLGCEIPVQ